MRLDRVSRHGRRVCVELIAAQTKPMQRRALVRVVLTSSVEMTTDLLDVEEREEPGDAGLAHLPDTAGVATPTDTVTRSW